MDFREAAAMKQAATSIQDSETSENDQDISTSGNEAYRWSFERLQSLIEGPKTNDLIELIGKTRVTYPLRIYRIASDMGFLVKGSGEDRNNIREACITIGRAFCKLQGKNTKSNGSYKGAAQEWVAANKPGENKNNTTTILKCAKLFLEEDLFLEGLNIVAKIAPIVLRKFVVTTDRPDGRMPNYPFKFLLFALNKFLKMKEDPPSNSRIYQVLSCFVTEQKIKEQDGEELEEEKLQDAIKKELERQRHDRDFVETLKAFYERCQEAYIWPYMTFIALEKVCIIPRIFIENPDAEFPLLSILFPDWDDVFPKPQESEQNIS